MEKSKNDNKKCKDFFWWGGGGVHENMQKKGIFDEIYFTLIFRQICKKYEFLMMQKYEF